MCLCLIQMAAIIEQTRLVLNIEIQTNTFKKKQKFLKLRQLTKRRFSTILDVCVCIKLIIGVVFLGLTVL